MSSRADRQRRAASRNRCHRQLLVELVEDRLLLSTFTVSNTGDSGPGTLRQAILDSNSMPDPSGQSNLIDFEIGVGTQVIHPTSSLPTITSTVAIDTTVSAFGSQQVVEIEGDLAGSGAIGLTVDGFGDLIQGLQITQFGGSGIVVEGGIGTTISQCTIDNNVGDGVDLFTPFNTITQCTITGNGNLGVTIDNAASNTVGPLDNISQNHSAGLYISGTGASGNTILGNSINGNLFGGGIFLTDGASNNQIGVPGQGNVVGDNNGNAIWLDAESGSAGLFSGIDVSGNQIQANSIGFNFGDGVLLSDAAGNLIGGNADLGEGNTVFGNTGSGVAIGSSIPANMPVTSRATGNLVEGNLIGTNGDGTAISDGRGELGNQANGVLLVNQAFSNTIGGTDPGTGNVISGNIGNGVDVTGSGTINNLVQGNFIGTDRSGSLSLPNNSDGVLVRSNASGNTIGGLSATAMNIISNNRGNGIEIALTASANLVEGNDIGSDATGSVDDGNVNNGISIVNGSNDNTIGGTVAGSSNLIFGNGGAGISLDSATSNLIQGNQIGLTLDGSLYRSTPNSDGTPHQIGNNQDGISLNTGSSNNTIGGTVSGARNVISGNIKSGVSIVNSSNDNLIEGNYVGLDPTGFIARGNRLNGIYITTSGNLVEGNAVSGNLSNGVDLSTNTATGNLIIGNFIGTDASGADGVPGRDPGLGADGLSIENLQDGVLINDDAVNNTVGGTSAQDRNVISGNGGNGVELLEINNDLAPGAPILGGDIVLGNDIGTDASGTFADGNAASGVFVYNASGITIGMPVAGGGNLISGNLSFGVSIYAQSGVGNLVQANLIGTNATNTGAIPNIGDGVAIIGASNNLVGGSGLGEGNVIFDNGGSGVSISSASMGTLVIDDVIEGNAGVGVSIVGETGTPTGPSTPDEANMILNDTIETNKGGGVSVVAAPGNQIGGLGAGQGNLILDNGGTGVLISSGSDSTLVVGNVISENSGDGVSISSGSDSLVAGNKIGLDASGEVSLGNTLDGVRLSNAGLGIQVLANVIASSGGAGVEVTGDSDTTVIQANLIGLDASGENTFANGAGVLIDGVLDVVVGGLTPGTCNTISGNGVGIEVTPAAINTSLGLDVLIAGNIVGLDASGTKALGNTFGIFLNDSVGVTVGGTTPGSRNVISGNTGVGVQVFRVSPGGSGNSIEGNIIGLDLSGQVVPSGALQPIGVFLNSASNNTVGGTVAGSGNVISGNTTGNVNSPSYGISIFGQSNAKPLDNVIEGNTIGTSASGGFLLGLDAARTPIQSVGVVINTSSGNTIGGSVASSSNTINGNGVGVQVVGVVAHFDGQPDGNVIVGDTIDSNTFGVFLNGAKGNMIIDDDLSRNTLIGLSIVGGAATANLVEHDSINQNGSTASRATDITMPGDGVYIDGASGNTVEFNQINQNGLSRVGVLPNGVGVYVFNNSSADVIANNTIVGSTAYGILVFNSASNLSSIPRTGSSQNNIGTSGIAKFREFTGAVLTSSSSSNSGIKTQSIVVPKGPKSLHARRVR